MTPESFEELLSYSRPQIQKTNRKYRKYARGAALSRAESRGDGPKIAKNVILRTAPRGTACSVNTLIEISVLPFGG